ncbi:MAG TPA: peptidoglycan-binding domain-containing protein [Blastocatellia bacterium]|nr:peptidoglycan-binding domain-containing protein [Blastocatellia bacterium]
MKRWTKILALSKVAILSATFFLASPLASAQDAAQNVDDANAPLKITYKEVAAIQAELQRRGYMNATPNGVLDAETRDAIKTFQKEKGLAETGRIDRETMAALEVTYPATGDEVESSRRSGLIPKIGYGVKDKASATGEAVTNTAQSVKETAKSGAEKTVDKTTELASDAVDKTGEVAQDAGSATVGGVKKVGRKVGDKTTRAGQRVGEVFVGRSDADIQSRVRDVLSRDESTTRVRSEVKDGAVRLTADASIDLSNAVSSIRKISGVKSVVVVSQ